MNKALENFRHRTPQINLNVTCSFKNNLTLLSLSDWHSFRSAGLSTRKGPLFFKGWASTLTPKGQKSSLLASFVQDPTSALERSLVFPQVRFYSISAVDVWSEVLSFPFFTAY